MYQINDQELEGDVPLMIETGVNKPIHNNGPSMHEDFPWFTRDMMTGNIEEWISVGPKKWRLDSRSEDGLKNYSILTDAVTNYTGLENFL